MSQNTLDFFFNVLHETNWMSDRWKSDLGNVLDLDVEQISLCIRCIEARMAHCESQRDQENRLCTPASECRFHPDTYIRLKHMLVQFKELLVATILEVREHIEDVPATEDAELDELSIAIKEL